MASTLPCDLSEAKTEAQVLCAEALTVAAVGGGVAVVYAPLGVFLLAAAGGLAVKLALDWYVDRTRLLAMRDAEITMDYYSERHRKGG